VWTVTEGERLYAGVSPTEETDLARATSRVDYSLFDDVVWADAGASRCPPWKHETASAPGPDT